MNETWNGKGSKSRVKDLKSYWDSPLWKNTNEMFFKKCLFLDDVRTPSQAYIYDKDISLQDASGIPSIKWYIVKSYDEFKEYIDRNGIPDVVSFDNDLWAIADELAENPDNKELIDQFLMINWEGFKIKTGAHCAEYLVNACKCQSKPIPTYYIHTANSAARPIIKRILEDGK